MVSRAEEHAARVGAQRLRSQLVEGGARLDAAAVVRHLGALQAQDYQQALWAIGLRAPSATLTEVERAMTDARIVRTWPMRGTLHFVNAVDARWMVGLSEARMLAKSARRRAALGLDARTIARAHETMRRALGGRKRLSRTQLLGALEQAGIHTADGRGYHLLFHAAQTGLVCLGPPKADDDEENGQAFVLLDEWAPRARVLARDEALAQLARRYAKSHGPATAQDFAWWAGLTITEARRALEAAAPDVVARAPHWLAADAEDARASAELHLLPAFDEYLLGYQDRTAVLAAAHAEKVAPGGNGVFRAIIVLGGQVVGTWTRARRRAGLELTLSPWTRIPRLRERAQAAAERFGAFFHTPITALTVSR